MKLDREGLILLLICLVLVVFSLLGLFIDFTKLMAFHPSIDGLLLLFTCLMMGGLFTLMLWQLAKAEGWIGKKSAAEQGK
jgi:hypothetical protein